MITTIDRTTELDRPSLPAPRGPRSAALLDYLVGIERRIAPPPAKETVGDDALGDDDLQLALYVCYELHYRGFGGVDDALEWDGEVLRFRQELERQFEHALELVVGRNEPREDRPSTALWQLIEQDDGPSLSSHMASTGTLEELREFALHRSAYQLKEADPHSWGIPRVTGGAQAALVTLQHDEYGAGRADASHAQLFATTLRALGLDDRYGAHLDRIPGVTLATVNLISLFGLHRRLRGALLGHLAAFEMTSVVPMGRYATALRRLGIDDDGAAFYDVHVEADAVHQHLAGAMVDELAADSPELAGDVVYGARCLFDLEGRFARHLLQSWAAGRSSLLGP